MSINIKYADGGENGFSSVAVSGQSDVVANSPTTTLTLVAGTNITIETDAGSRTVTITAAGGGSVDILGIQVFS